jgi:hypothetical protein
MADSQYDQQLQTGETKTKSVRMMFASILVLATSAAFAASDAQKSFDQLKSLAGTWEGKGPDGKMVDVDFRVTGGGSALMSEIKGGEDMISMFHLDNDRLLMTHYCGAGNQPRMQATASPDGKSITFDFVDGTNLNPQQPGHMQRLVVSMPDADHHSEEWTFAANDGKEMRERFDLTRKK